MPFAAWKKELFTNGSKKIPLQLLPVLNSKDQDTALTLWDIENVSSLLESEVKRIFTNAGNKTESEATPADSPTFTITKQLKTLSFDESKSHDISDSTSSKGARISSPEFTNGTKCLTCGKPATNVCSRCEAARYCSVLCQRRDWTRHRGRCGVVLRHSIVNEIVPHIAAELFLLFKIWSKPNLSENERVRGAVLIDCVDWRCFRGEGKFCENNLFVSFCPYEQNYRKELETVFEEGMKKEKENDVQIVCCDTSGYAESMFVPFGISEDFKPSSECVIFEDSPLCVIDMTFGNMGVLKRKQKI